MDKKVINTTQESTNELIKINNSWFYKCEQCDHMAVTKSLLKIHAMLTHCDDDTPFLCSSCSYRATTRANLRRHEAVAHSEGNRSRLRSCPLCEYSSLRVTALRTHIKEVHLKEKPHQCGECPFRCSRTTDLKRHLVACHEKKGAYQCTKCNYSTSTGSSFSKHCRNYH
ncbi:unnamed protein product [Nezara viridula]|uniref:C2H2-type domain-containing protein n=1 Tax=Nezara viridula TaxID=85310 RepID=A0A9P0GY62_NEZVI|nr:unnamed protein product [Nezara viridula]